MVIPYSFNPLAVGAVFAIEYSRGVFVYNSDGAKVSAAMSVSDITLDYFNRQNMSVWSGGRANGVTVFSGCKINVYLGGSCSGVEINSGGKTEVYFGGIISSVQIKAAASLYISSGGVVHDLVVSEGGQITMQSSAVLSGGIFMSGADGLTVSSGSVIESAKFEERARALLVSCGGVCRDITMRTAMLVSSGGLASNVELNGAGNLTVLRGGQVYRLLTGPESIVSCAIYGEDSATVITGSGARGEFFVSSGSGVNLDIYGEKNCLNVYVGGQIRSARVYSGGGCCISAGGSGERCEIFSGGEMYLESAGTASGITVHSGAVFSALNYASCREITADGGTICNGFSAQTYGVQIAGGGSQRVNPGGATCSVKISSGLLSVSSGTGSGLIIYSGGSCSARNPLWLDDIVVKSGGTLIVNGGRATNVSSASGAICITSNGGEIEYVN